ncbi:toxin RelE1 (plasmid) [Calothrix brevissima NIES-22]|nr:toxin RelE1 [Calothrix brevissima NIES-22]
MINFIDIFLCAIAELLGLLIVSSGESLQQNPRRGAIVDEIAGLRKLLVSFGKYGFIIHYVILENDVVILRVYHGRENRPR